MQGVSGGFARPASQGGFWPSCLCPDARPHPPDCPALGWPHIEPDGKDQVAKRPENLESAKGEKKVNPAGKVKEARHREEGPYLSGLATGVSYSGVVERVVHQRKN